jgi:hypothetical protein
MDIKEYQVGQMHQNESIHPWEKVRVEVVQDIVSKYLPKRNITGLDLGCGDIYFLDQFSKKYNGNYYAVDIAFTDEIIEKLTLKYQNPNINLFNSLEQIPENLKIDVVFAMDVIEHIENPIEFLKTLINQNYIDKNTLFLFTVPAFQCLFSNHDTWLGHIKRYSHKLLNNEISLAGLKRINHGYFFTILLFPRLLTKVFEKFKINQEKKTGIGNWQHGKIVTHCVKTMLKIDYYCFGKILVKFGIKTPGLSLYTVCKLNN